MKIEDAIDRIMQIKVFNNQDALAIVKAKNALEKQLNPDFAEVVRCKDCQKRNTALCPYKYAEMATTDILTDDNEFCSYGKQERFGLLFESFY